MICETGWKVRVTVYQGDPAGVLLAVGHIIAAGLAGMTWIRARQTLRG